jgi:hypothetical protein
MAASPLIRDAFESARKDFIESLTDGDDYDFSGFRTIDDVYNETDRIQQEQAKKGALRNLKKIQPYLSHLEQYSGVIETFVQAKSDVLALIWVCNQPNRMGPQSFQLIYFKGPIKLLLQVCWTDRRRCPTLLIVCNRSPPHTSRAMIRYWKRWLK